MCLTGSCTVSYRCNTIGTHAHILQPYNFLPIPTIKYYHT